MILVYKSVTICVIKLKPCPSDHVLMSMCGDVLTLHPLPRLNMLIYGNQPCRPLFNQPRLLWVGAVFVAMGSDVILGKPQNSSQNSE